LFIFYYHNCFAVLIWHHLLTSEHEFKKDLVSNSVAFDSYLKVLA